MTDLARMTLDQLRAHITDLTEDTGALIIADGDTLGGGWTYEDTGSASSGSDSAHTSRPANAAVKTRDEARPHPSSLDYTETYEQTSDISRGRIAANLIYWAYHVAAAVTARDGHAGAPAPGSGTRTIRANKPSLAPHAASRAHPPQPAAGTATDTRTATPA